MAQDTTAAGKNDCNDVDHPLAVKAIKMMAGAYNAEATQKKSKDWLRCASRWMLMAK